LGLDLPKIKKVLPTNLPRISATELRADGLFILEGDIILVLEYESTVKRDDFVKYLEYMLAVLKNYFEDEKITDIIVAVIYTGDIISAPSELKFKSLSLNIEQVFLSKLDTNAIYSDLKAKVESGTALSDEDVVKFIVMPLTEPVKNKKQEIIEKSINLAIDLRDEDQRDFIILGILVATNKFIDEEYAKKIKELIYMTKVALVYEKEKNEAVKEAVREAALSYEKEKREAVYRKEMDLLHDFTRKILSQGEEISKITEYTGFSEEEILKIRSEMR
jgi:hypothetical protein